MSPIAKSGLIKSGMYIVSGILIFSILLLVHSIRENTAAQQAVFQSNTVMIEGMQHLLSTHALMK